MDGFTGKVGDSKHTNIDSFSALLTVVRGGLYKQFVILAESMEICGLV